MRPTDPKNPDKVTEDKRIPLYDEIGEDILKGIEEITDCRDVLFKWKENEKSTPQTMDTSSWIIQTFTNLPGAKF